MPDARDIAPATGRLGVLTPGLGAVASTFIAGVLSARQKGEAPIGSVSQTARVRLGDRADDRNPLIKDFVPLASLDDIVFGGWDPISPNALEAARTAGVLEERDLAPISAEMEGIVAMDAVFDQRWVSRLEGTRVKTGATKWDLAEQVMA
jgi:myo-inositol-1-phosphate synthase